MCSEEPWEIVTTQLHITDEKTELLGIRDLPLFLFPRAQGQEEN